VALGKHLGKFRDCADVDRFNRWEETMSDSAVQLSMPRKDRIIVLAAIVGVIIIFMDDRFSVRRGVPLPHLVKS
jgi:hypothetical protein